MAAELTTDEIAKFLNQQHELNKRVLRGTLDLAQVRPALQDIIDGKFAKVARFDRYNAMLLSLDNQLAKLRIYNEVYWNNVLTDEHFFELAFSAAHSEHEQRVDDLLLLYVDFGSPEATFEAWWKVLCGTQPGNYRWEQLRTDTEHLKLHDRARTYDLGIHVVHINLVAHWEPKDGRNVVSVREQAETNDELLAHAEAMAAYGLHPELLREQNGENLPYVDLAGYMADTPDDGAWRHVPYFNWRRGIREVGLYADWDVYSDGGGASPVVWES